jgi:hypothetical protein
LEPGGGSRNGEACLGKTRLVAGARCLPRRSRRGWDSEPPVSKRCTSDARFYPSCRPTGELPIFRQPATSIVLTVYRSTYPCVHTFLCIKCSFQEHCVKIALVFLQEHFLPLHGPKRPDTPGPPDSRGRLSPHELGTDLDQHHEPATARATAWLGYNGL